MTSFAILWKDRWIRGAFLVLVTVIGISFVGPFFQHWDPNVGSDLQFGAPGSLHWFGTDFHGRDNFARLLSGLRLSFMVGIIGATVSLLVGVSVGMAAGYVGGKTDALLMRLVDVLFSLPRLVFVIVLIALLEGPTTRILNHFNLGLFSSNARLILLFAGLGLVEWLTMARIIRGQVLVLKESTFVQAARALGQTHLKILTRHLLPNLGGIIIVYITLTIPVVILEESFLSFLGLGVQAPSASLGSLIAEGAQYLNPFKIYWWLLLFPSGTMAILLLALNFLGDGLRDAIDPRQKK